MAGDPLKHHYIPEFYSKRWARGDGRLVRYVQPRAGKIEERWKFPSELGFERLLYTIPGEIGPAAQILESGFFREIDSRASTVFQKMNEPTPMDLSNGERTDWTNFTRSLLHRTPEALRATKSAGIQTYKEVLEKLRSEYARLRKPGNPDTYEEFVATQDVVTMESGFLKLLGGLILNSRLVEFTNGLVWRYIDVPEGGRTFLISDDPIFRSNGLGNEYGILAMPISPTRVFVASNGMKPINFLTAQTHDDLLNIMNINTVTGARYFVGAADLSQDAFVREYYGVAPRDALMQPYAV